MLHQTLIFSPSATLLSNLSTSSSPSPRSARSAALQCSKVEEQGMEATKKSSNLASGDEFAPVWSLERGEAFSVDDLLDLGDFGDGELESEEFGEQLEGEDHSNSCSSAISFDLPPPPSLEDMALPAHDASDLEWVSLIIDDSLPHIPSSAATGPPTEVRRAPHMPAPPKPTTFASPTVCALSTEVPVPIPVPVRAKRSKRSRAVSGSAGSWSSSARRSLLADSSSSTASSASSSSSVSSSYFAFDRAFLLYDAPPLAPKRPKHKKRGRKPKLHYPPSAAPPVAAGERRCSHCGVQKTPQWRAGPLGAKTLCNACGVRFKSGRLLPEYRPACSPTFVNALHSNSHRKVLEMRRKKEADFMSATAPPPVASY